MCSKQEHGGICEKQGYLYSILCPDQKHIWMYPVKLQCPHSQNFCYTMYNKLWHHTKSRPHWGKPIVNLCQICWLFESRIFISKEKIEELTEKLASLKAQKLDMEDRQSRLEQACLMCDEELKKVSSDEVSLKIPLMVDFEHSGQWIFFLLSESVKATYWSHK